jgi:wyosine [tRNA(Phe)-imidazoG37] synthetase (radical SAM superfamily)
MYKHLFGPVPSRRLGMSLGIDLIPHKVCSLNCIYCECGKTTRLTLQRDEYVPTEDVMNELSHFFSCHPDPDFITFSGAGEPTLHLHIGRVLRFLKELRPGVPVAVLTNGTLFSDPAVRKELLEADVVLPSLDAATRIAFQKINRPPRGFTVEQYVRGLAAFSREFGGELWLEVLILPGYNDDPANLLALKTAIREIGPDRVQLNTLDRPGIIPGLRAATREEMERIAAEWEMEHVEIVARTMQRHQETAFRSDVESAILETIARRPCTPGDIRDILGIHIHEVNKVLSVLQENGRVEASVQERGTFYRVRKS